MFKNKNSTFKINFKKPGIYFSYIFNNFAIIFFLWLFAFFVVLFAINQSESVEGFNISKNLFFSFVETVNELNNNISIVCLVSCIHFFLKTSKSFNIYVLESFGLKFSQILKPIIIFLLILCLLKIFFINPMYVKLFNYSKIIRSDIKKNDDFIKNGSKFILINTKDDNNYMTIFGNYINHNDEILNFKNAIFLLYKNNELSTCYSSDLASLNDDEFILYNANVTYVNNKKAWQDINKNIRLKSSVKIKEFVRQIRNNDKLKKSISLDVYEYIKFFLRNKKNNSIKNSLDANAILYLFNDIIFTINIVLCCFMSFFFCANNSRNFNSLKNVLKCFILYFLLLRLFYFFENIIMVSKYMPIYIIGVDIMLCVFMYYLIIDKDYCKFYSKNIKKDIYFFIKKNYLIFKKKLSFLKY